MKQLTRRAFTRLTLSLLLAALAGIALLVFVIDPFQIYRLARWYKPPIDNTTQVYSNAGIVRHYAYDSAIVGSSVTENFRPTYMDGKLGGRFIKLCTSAATAYNHALLMHLAFETHEVKRIVYGLDVYSFIAETEKTGSEVPFYLYNNNPFDDVKYWLNRSVIGSFLPRCLRAWGQVQDDSVRDAMYCWAGRDPYGPIALYTASFTPPAEEQPESAFLDKARANLEVHLLPYITSHPETQFDIFFPPYSAAEWATMKSKGTLPALLAVRDLCYTTLRSCPNVRLYDYQTREEWVLNLDNYKDTLHYGQWVNDALTDCIASQDGLVVDSASFFDATRTLESWADRQIEAGGWVF